MRKSCLARVAFALGVASPLLTAASDPGGADQAAYPLVIAGKPGMSLYDGTLREPISAEAFVQGISRPTIDRVLAGGDAAGDDFVFALRPLLVRDGNRVMLFDTGGGSNYGANAGRLGSSLAAAGIAADAVTDVFISHSHPDHIGGVMDAAGKLIFPNATIHMSAPEWAWLRRKAASPAERIGEQRVSELVRAMSPRIAPFAPGARLVEGRVSAVPIVGHTPGHSGYRIGTGSRSVLFIGDGMHHYVTSVVHPEWPVGYDTNKTRSAKTRIASRTSWANGRQLIYAEHFPSPGMGRIARTPRGYAWQPAER